MGKRKEDKEAFRPVLVFKHVRDAILTSQQPSVVSHPFLRWRILRLNKVMQGHPAVARHAFSLHDETFPSFAEL